MGGIGISDHSPIYLEIMNSNYKPNSPFKFNSIWLSEEEGYVKDLMLWLLGIWASQEILFEIQEGQQEERKILSLYYQVEEPDEKKSKGIDLPY